MPNENAMLNVGLDDQKGMSCERGMRPGTVLGKKKSHGKRVCMGAVMTEMKNENML